MLSPRAVTDLERALKRSGHGETIEDVKDALAENNAQLWNAHNSTAVTEITRDLNIWLYGGSLDDLEGLEASATAWARKMGLGSISIEGRKGWTRALKRLGYVEKTILVKDL